MAIGLDERYITDLSIQQYFVDKDTGLPLANGLVYFYEDDNRNLLKPVYELTGAPPNYCYAPLPNPMTLSAVGTPMDADGNDVAVYFFPYENNGTTLQLYYIATFDQNAVPQITREAWPNLTSGNDPVADAGQGVTNELSNPVFSDVLFDSPVTLTYTGNSETLFTIAPDWKVRVVHTAGGSIIVTRTTVAGSLGYPTNPPYTITIGAGANATALELIQDLDGVPGLWSKKVGVANGYVASNITLAHNTSATLIYRNSLGNEQVLLTAVNISGVFAEYRNTVQLEPSDNTQIPPSGGIDFVISLDPTTPSTFTSVQAVGMAANELNVPFDEIPQNRVVDHLFHYYKPQLEQKPIPSYLVGWNFAQNPAQWGSVFAVAAIGDNQSDYVWDQTIVFQDIDIGFSAARHATGALEITIEVVDTRIALIQYLEQAVTREALNDEIAIHIAANKSTGDDVIGTVSLWYTSAALPDMTGGTNDSLVSAIDVNGVVTAGNGTWAEVPRRNGEAAKFTLTSTPNVENYNDYDFNGWDMAGIAAVTTATNMAIVISFPSQANTDVLEFHSITLSGGDIATRPAPISMQESLQECQRYYEKSYGSGIVPATVSLPNAIVAAQKSSLEDAGPNFDLVGEAFSIEFKAEKNSIVPDITIYSPNSGTVDRVYSKMRVTVTGTAANADVTLSTFWTQAGLGDTGVYYEVTASTIAANTVASNGTTDTINLCSSYLIFHYVADARIGIA